MSSINELINSEADEALRAGLLERLEIVAHKIRFMDRVPVVCLNTLNLPDLSLSDELQAAGGLPETDLLGAVYIIYYEPGKTLNDLMREVPPVLDQEWPAVKNGRIILLNDDVEKLRTAENAVSLVEDLAEMLHPGHFIFGSEGDKWIRFGV